MKYSRLFAISIFLLILFINFKTNAQEIDKKLNIENLTFGIYTIPAQKIDTTNLYIYLKIPYSFFRFVKESDSFFADYEFAVEITSKDSKKISNKILQEKLKVSDFTETNSDEKYVVKEIDFSISSGKYEVRLIITDLDIKKSVSLAREVIVQDFWKDKIGIGDVLFSVEKDSIGKQYKNLVFPKPQLNVDYNSSLLIDYFIFKSDLNSKLNVITKIFPKFSPNSPVFEKKEEILDKQYVTKKEKILFPTDLETGPYKLRIELSNGKFKKEYETQFYIMWENYPTSERDLNLSSEQMKYILTDEEYNKVSSLNEEEKRKFFFGFWEKIDVDTTTHGQRLMEEYFRRVDYTNQNFSVPDKKGWSTDMGKIYILYGNPDNIIKKHNLMPPYETWEYFNIDRRYIFWDEFSTGVFKLKSVYNIKK